jgi:hypothetical protein
MTSRAIKVATLFLMIAPAAGAAVITISDLLDGSPFVTISADLIGAQTTLTPEQAVITGVLPAGVTATPGTRSVILLEPSSDPFGPPQSDFLTLMIGAAAPTFAINFESDGAVNFTRDLAALPPGTPTLLENGTFQELSGILNSGSFSIQVQSDLASQEPEPSTWILLVSGLSLGSMWRIRRRFPRSH